MLLTEHSLMVWWSDKSFKRSLVPSGLWHCVVCLKYTAVLEQPAASFTTVIYLMLEAAGSYKTSHCYQTVCHQKLECRILHSHCHENLQCNFRMFSILTLLPYSFFLYTLKYVVKSINNDRFEGVTLKNMILHTCTHLYMVQYVLIDLINGYGAVHIDVFNL